ncbi:MAG: hypothetical protein LH647_07210 [Leptolyngbyaceae cyanobacterium CAN_BIN12]|nr:hypothetical protein [Leptolyngbyaceae cyanobacterium CAN_BIN12]
MSPRSQLLARSPLENGHDEILDRIYIDIDRRCKDDRDRLEKLFELYTKMTTAQALPKSAARQG